MTLGPHNHFHNHILIVFRHNSRTHALHRVETVVQSDSPVQCPAAKLMNEWPGCSTGLRGFDRCWPTLCSLQEP